MAKKTGNVIIMERSRHISEGSNYRFGLDCYNGLSTSSEKEIDEKSDFNLNNREKIEKYMKEAKWA